MKSDVRSSRPSEIRALQSWHADLSHRRLGLASELGSMGSPDTAGDALVQAEERTSLLRDLRAHDREADVVARVEVALFVAHAFDVYTTRARRWP